MDAVPDEIIAKVDRARHDFEELNLEIAAFLDTHPYTVRHEVDLATNTIGFFVDITAQTPPEWGAIVSEILHLLRSSLDNLVCALTRDGDCSRTEFPIYTDAGRYDKEGLVKIRQLAPGVRAYIKRIQPFSDSGERNALWVLHELNRLDKHRSVHLTSSMPIEPTDITFDAPGDATVQEAPGFHGSPFQDGAEFARFRAVGCPPNQVNVEAKFTFHICFDKGSGPAEGSRVLTTLRSCYEVVAAIMNTVDSEWPDLIVS